MGKGRDVGKQVGGHFSVPCPVLQPGSYHTQWSDVGAQGSPSFEITITRNAKDGGSQVRDAFGGHPEVAEGGGVYHSSQYCFCSDPPQWHSL